MCPRHVEPLAHQRGLKWWGEQAQSVGRAGSTDVRVFAGTHAQSAPEQSGRVRRAASRPYGDRRRKGASDASRPGSASAVVSTRAGLGTAAGFGATSGAGTAMTGGVSSPRRFQVTSTRPYALSSAVEDAPLDEGDLAPPVGYPQYSSAAVGHEGAHKPPALQRRAAPTGPVTRTRSPRHRGEPCASTGSVRIPVSATLETESDPTGRYGPVFERRRHSPAADAPADPLGRLPKAEPLTNEA